jgi:hypothetical protein
MVLEDQILCSSKEEHKVMMSFEMIICLIEWDQVNKFLNLRISI